jgi:hypothetical protein
MMKLNDEGPSNAAHWYARAKDAEARLSRQQGLQEVHAVQWYADGGRTRCLEVFDGIGPARVFADHLPVGASACITTMAVRGEAYTRGFCGA